MILDNPTETKEANGQVLHPGSRSLFRHWEALRAEAACPPRSAFKLEPLKAIIPNLLIIEQKSLPRRYILRLCGTSACDILGREATATDFLESWDSFERKLIDEVLANAVRHQQPALLRMRLTRQSGAMAGVELLALPLQAESGKIHLVSGLFSFAKLPAYVDPIVKQELITVRSLWTEHGAGDVLLRSIESRGTPMLRVIEGGLAKN